MGGNEKKIPKMEKYDNFITEAVSKKSKSTFQVGDCILFNSQYQGIDGIKGQVGEIIEIDSDPKAKAGQSYNPYASSADKNVYIIRFQRPVRVFLYVNRRNYYGQWEQKIEIEEKETLSFPKQALIGIEIIPSEYADKFMKGEIAKYKASNVFNGLLKSIGFKVTAKYCDATYFDVDREKEDMVTYMPLGKIKDLEKERSEKSKKNITKFPLGYHDPSGIEEDDDYYYKTRFRQPSKLGRVFRKLNPSYKDNEIENFVLEYRAEWKRKMEQLENRLRVVNGEDIVYWYLNTRYEKGGGSLNNSCMQGSGAQSQIKFYANNPDSIALAILVSEDEKLQARALVWRCVEPEGVIFMDRIYSVKPEHAKMLHNFAKENGIVTKSEGYNNKHRLKVRVKPWRGAMPYLDTMRLSSSEKNTLIN